MDKTIFLKVKRLQEDIDASSGVLPRKDVEKQLPVDAFDQLVTMDRMILFSPSGL